MAFRRWRQRETVKRHVLAVELEGHYIIGIPRGSGVGSKLADFCNTASVGPRQYVLVRGSSEGWCRRSEVQSSRLLDHRSDASNGKPLRRQEAKNGSSTRTQTGRLVLN